MVVGAYVEDQFNASVNQCQQGDAQGEDEAAEDVGYVLRPGEERQDIRHIIRGAHRQLGEEPGEMKEESTQQGHQDDHAGQHKGDAQDDAGDLKQYHDDLARHAEQLLQGIAGTAVAVALREVFQVVPDLVKLLVDVFAEVAQVDLLTHHLQPLGRCPGFGDDQPHDQVDQDGCTIEQCEHDECHTEPDRIDVEICAEPAADTSQHGVVGIAEKGFAARSRPVRGSSGGGRLFMLLPVEDVLRPSQQTDHR